MGELLQRITNQCLMEAGLRSTKTLRNASGPRSVRGCAYTTTTNTVISGADSTLSAAATQAMAMVLQELVANAVKCCAVSTPHGQVIVSWDHQPDGAAAASLRLLGARSAGRQQALMAVPVTVPTSFAVSSLASSVVRSTSCSDPTGALRYSDPS
jgi:hypothetical protein